MRAAATKTWYVLRESSRARLKMARADAVPSVRRQNFMYWM